MKFTETPLDGAYLVELEPIADERGFFARTYCRDEFNERGIDFELAQTSISFNAAAATLRGLHFQDVPHEEAKLVSCVAGALFDVIVDLRPGSPTYASWYGTELRAGDNRMLFAPRGFAHGFQTLSDRTLVAYAISTPYEPRASRGVRWDDPTIDVRWPPAPRRVMSERDLALPFLRA